LPEPATKSAVQDEASEGFRQLRYMHVQHTLMQRIAENAYPVASRLPTEGDLCKEFQVSRHTVREALRHLREAGYISSRQGSGYMVEGMPAQQRFVHTVNSVDELMQYVANAKLEVLGSEMVQADAALAARLNCSPGRKWLRLWGVRTSPHSPIPIGCMEVFVHSAYAGIRELIPQGREAIYAIIEREYGERVEEVVQTLRGSTLPEEFANELQLPAGSAALLIERVFKSTNHKVIEISFNYHPMGRFSYTMVLRSQAPE